LKMNWIRTMVVLAFLTALVPSLAAQEASNHPRIISVTGTAEIKVAPDEVTLTLAVDSHDRDLGIAKADNDQRMKKLLSAAHTAGVEAKNIQTSALTMEPEYSDDRTPKFLGYQVSQVVMVTLTDISKYEELMTEFLKAGVNRVYGINFVVANPIKYREEARLQALRAAREKAKAMAGELGQTIGKPWEIIEDSADVSSVNGRSVNYLAGFGRKLPMQQGEATIAGGENVIQASVHVSFLLE